MVRLAKKLMAAYPLKICIIDDKQTYFSEAMLRVAASAGFPGIERHLVVDNKLMSALLETPPDIIILDIKGVAEPDVAKDGFGIARLGLNRFAVWQ